MTPDDYTFVYLPSAPAAGLGPRRVHAAWSTRPRSPRPWGWSCGGWASGDHARDVAARQLVLAVLAALILNAAMCGVLSGPQHRYQARVVWLLPLLAGALLLQPAGRLSPAPRAAFAISALSSSSSLRRAVSARRVSAVPGRPAVGGGRGRLAGTAGADGSPPVPLRAPRGGRAAASAPP